jgi:hypothetical protein
LTAARGVFRRRSGARKAAHLGFGSTGVSGTAPANAPQVPPRVISRSRAHEPHARHRQQNLFVLAVPAVDVDAPFRYRLRRGRDPTRARKFPRGDIALFPGRQMSSLHDGKIVVWDSLAIIEYVAELHPHMPIWPRPRAARAQARSPAAEMHSGFIGMRGLLPMNMRREVKLGELTLEASADVASLEQAFGQAHREFGQAGAFLFGGRRDVRAGGQSSACVWWSIVCMCIRWRSRPARGPIWTR